MTSRAPQQQQETTVSRTAWAMDELAGNYSDMESLAAALKMAAENCRLVGGATVGPLPLGCEAQLVVIPIRLEDCYPIKTPPDEEQRYGFGKDILTTIWHAAGGQWDGIDRIDDNKHPFFAHVRVRGHYRQNDGTLRSVCDERDCDYREGSAQIAGKGDKEVPKLRETVLRRAITGAKLRAIREGFGIKHGAPASDLDRPFVVMKVVFTGRAADPATQLVFAQAIAHSHMLAAGAMYGVPAALPAARDPLALPPGPGAAVDLADIDEDEDGPDGVPVDDDEAPESAPRAAPPVRPASPAATRKGPASPPPPVQRPAAPPPKATVIPFGKSKGTPITEASDEDLEGCIKVLKKRVGEDPRGKYAAANKKLIAAMGSELDHRQGRVSEDEEREIDRGDDPENY